MRILLLDYGKPEARYDWSELEVEFDITIVSIPPSWEVADSVDEKFHNFLIDKVINQKFDLIFMPVSVTNAYSSYTGMRLGMHLRLSSLPSLSLERRLVPIIFMGFETELQVFKQSEYAQFLLTPSVYYIQHTIKAVKYAIDNVPSAAPIELNAFSESLSLYPIQPEPHLESSHSLANEWGAFELDRLTVNCLKDKPNNLDFNLYIKWLECKFGVDRKELPEKGLDVPDIISGKKILFIDDEWDKRWNDVLKEIFEKAKEFKCLKLTKGLERERAIKLAEAEIKSTDWDLILLDLRLTESDHDGRPSDFTGEEILEFIKGGGKRKGHNSTLPVIMFTASTKATIIDNLYEKGADGHFIKHSPSDSRTPDKVKESVQAFLNTVKNCLDKGALLQPYWKRIQEVNANNLLKGNERTINGQDTKFEERIVERLIMFVGLLKKSYEQTDFDQNTFFYDQYETAFLTLWSVFNEMSVFYFERTDDQGEITWKIVNQRQETVFLTEIGYDSFCEFEIKPPLLNVRNLNSTEIQKVRNRKSKVDYHNKLQIQVAFLIDKSDIIREAFYNQLFLKYGSTYDPSASLGRNMCDREWRNFKNSILPLLNESNKKRNKLNLTHASDSLIDYTHSLKGFSIKINKQDIDDLFKVVLFLITGVN